MGYRPLRIKFWQGCLPRVLLLPPNWTQSWLPCFSGQPWASGWRWIHTHLPPPSSLPSIGGVARGYIDVPQVESGWGAPVPTKHTTWRNRLRLSSKACKLMAAKANSAAGQAASALHAMAVLQVHQAKALKQMHEGCTDPRLMQELRSATDFALRACSATLSRTLPSSSRQYRSRLRPSSTSCPDMILLLPLLHQGPAHNLLVTVGTCILHSCSVPCWDNINAGMSSSIQKGGSPVS